MTMVSFLWFMLSLFLLLLWNVKGWCYDSRTTTTRITPCRNPFGFSQSSSSSCWLSSATTSLTPHPRRPTTTRRWMKRYPQRTYDHEDDSMMVLGMRKCTNRNKQSQQQQHHLSMYYPRCPNDHILSLSSSSSSSSSSLLSNRWNDDMDCNNEYNDGDNVITTTATTMTTTDDDDDRYDTIATAALESSTSSNSYHSNNKNATTSVTYHEKLSDMFSIRQNQSLMEISLLSDPEWNQIRIPFLETRTITDRSGRTNQGHDDEDEDDEAYGAIDTKLAFLVQVDQTMYGIGIPYDTPVMIVMEELHGNGNHKVQCLSPDNPDHEEIIQIMAQQVRDVYGTNATMKHTPRILTIAGSLGLEDWSSSVLPPPIPATTLLPSVVDDDDMMKSFHDFMKQELGEEEYTKTLQGHDDDDEQYQELYDIITSFDDHHDITPEEDDVIESLVAMTMENPRNDHHELTISLNQALHETFGGATQKKKMNTISSSTKTSTMDHDGVGLKLISYLLPSDHHSTQKLTKSYSLVTMFKPYALVAKCIQESDDDNVRFELLHHWEESIIIPKLEEILYHELQQINLQFPTTTTTTTTSQ